MKTNIDLIEYAKKALNSDSCYIYGTFGQLVTEKLIDEKAAQYPSQMTPNRVATAKKTMINKHAWDCSGLIKGCIMDGKYIASEDLNARGMYNACTNKGVIISPKTIAPGELVFNKSLTHVGIWTGSEVIEAKGFNYGLRKTVLSDFYYHGRYTHIKYVEPSSQQVTSKLQASYVAKVICIFGINIRKTPEGEKIGAYNWGDRVYILEDSGEWSRTNKGWICNKYIKRL